MINSPPFLCLCPEHSHHPPEVQYATPTVAKDTKDIPEMDLLQHLHAQLWPPVQVCFIHQSLSGQTPTWSQAFIVGHLSLSIACLVNIRNLHFNAFTYHASPSAVLRIKSGHVQGSTGSLCCCLATSHSSLLSMLHYCLMQMRTGLQQWPAVKPVPSLGPIVLCLNRPRQLQIFQKLLSCQHMEAYTVQPSSPACPVPSTDIHDI